MIQQDSVIDKRMRKDMENRLEMDSENVDNIPEQRDVNVALVQRLKCALANASNGNTDITGVSNQINECLARIPKYKPIPPTKDWTLEFKAWQDELSLNNTEMDPRDLDLTEKDKRNHLKAINKRVTGWWNCNDEDLESDFESFLQDIVDQDFI